MSKKCIACGKGSDRLYGGYCIKCFQTVKMEKDKDKIDDTDCYIDDTTVGVPIDQLIKRSTEISAERYSKK